jgi:AraC-like DNA-binding protein
VHGGEVGAHGSRGGGQSHTERPPSPALAGVVSSVWFQRVSANAVSYSHRTVPNGCVELRCRVGREPRVFGPWTRPLVEVVSPGTTIVGVRFHPGVAASALGLPASELVDQVVDVGEVWGRSAAWLGERIAESSTPQAALAVLQEQTAGRLTDAARPDSLVLAAVHELRPWGVGDVGSLTSKLHVSESQLRRRCKAAVGLSPKILHRMLRFQGLMALAQLALTQGRSPAVEGLARLATEAGYADQSHLTRECVRMTGLTPTTFLDQTERACGCGHDHAASYAPLLRRHALAATVSV